MTKLKTSFIAYCLTALAGLQPICQAKAQSPYELKGVREYVLGGTGILFSLGGTAIQRSQQPPDLQEITALDRSQVNRFDRSATWNYSIQAAHTSDILALGAQVLPLLLLTDKNMRQDSRTLGVMYFHVMSLTYGETQLAKGLAGRMRPYAYNEDVPDEIKMKRDTRASFFSGHTSMTSAACFFTASVFADYHPDSPWRPAIWSGAAVIPAVTGYLRYKSGKHFPTDIIAGYAAGILNVWLIRQLHRTGNPQGFE